MAYNTIVVEIDDYVALIRLNRPEAKNALNSEMRDELADAVRSLDANDKVRCLVVTGSEQVFAAGTDVAEIAETTFAEAFAADLLSGPAEGFMACRKPVVAAVAGYALGAGCELALMCDIVIAADSAKFGQPEINRGTVAGMGGTQRLARAVGKAKAMDMHLTGRFMEAAEAERAGLVSRVVPAKKLVDEALAAAHRVAEKPALAAMAVKEAVNRSDETPLSEGLRFERRLFQALFATEDQKEGAAAFLEKREPQFRGR